MNSSSQHKKINLDGLNSYLVSSLIKTSNFLDLVNKLKTAQDFINSASWKDMKCNPNRHDIIYGFFTEVFGNRRGMITDGYNVINDSQGLYTDLSSEEKDFVKSVDTKKQFGVFKFGRLYSMYIGTTYTAEETGEQELIAQEDEMVAASEAETDEAADEAADEAETDEAAKEI